MNRSADLQPARGMTIIEMMVALLIGSVLSLAVFTIMATFEGRRRTLTSGGDLDQAGSLAMYQIDRWIRSAGTGFAQPIGVENQAMTAYGCLLNVGTSGGVQILPSTSAFAAPFAAVNPGVAGQFRLAPVVILPGQTTPGMSGSASDVLVVMSAAAGAAEVPVQFSAFGTATQLQLQTTVGFVAGDLVLVADGQADASGVKPCLMSQAATGVSGGATAALALGGAYAAASVNSLAMSNFTLDAGAYNLGNVGLGRAPSFQLIGVGDNNTLFTLDLLRTAGTTAAEARADGVFELHALYGVDTTGANTITAWESPSTSINGYKTSELMNGSVESAERIRRIKAIRVGLILRTSLPERDVVAPASLTLFEDLGALKVTRTLLDDAAASQNERHFRYRTVEATIPVRNNFY